MERETELLSVKIGSSPEKTLERDLQKKATELVLTLATMQDVIRERSRSDVDLKSGVTASLSKLVSTNLLWNKYKDAEAKRGELLRELMDSIPEDVKCGFDIPVDSNKANGVRSIRVDRFNNTIHKDGFDGNTTPIYADGKFA